MKLGFLILSVTATLLLSACHHEPVQSVKWYMAHNKERAATLERCQAMPKAEVATDANCSHAIAAVHKADSQAKPWIDMPMNSGKKE
jgi:hypothetical protein